MSEKSLQRALDFIENEKQFHLGFLPTEQSSPLTRNLDKEFARSTMDGVKNLQSVDRNVLAMAKRIFVSEPFLKLTDSAEKTLRNGGKIVFPAAAPRDGSASCWKACGATAVRKRPGRHVTPIRSSAL